METEPTPRFFRRIPGGKEDLGVFRGNADAVIAHVDVEKLPLDAGSDLNARLFLESARGCKFINGFNRIFDQIDHHLLKLAFLNPNLLRGVLAVDVNPDPPFLERILQYPDGL